MSDKVTNMQDRLPCANGCIRKGTEEEPVPLEAHHGNLCNRCFGRIKSALELAPDVVEHVVSMVDANSGGSDDRVDGSRDAPLPFNTTAFNDANEIYQRLVYWSILWADRLKVQAPGPAVRSWRAESGFVVGLPADIAPGSARYLAGVMSAWLMLKLEEIAYLLPLDDVNYFADELRDVFRVNARWPSAAKPRYSDVPCPVDGCGQRLAVYPPVAFEEDEKFICDRGHHIPPDRYEFYVNYYAQVQAETDPVKRHLLKKYGRTA